MFLAPAPQLSGTLTPMAGGVRGIRQTVRTMRRLVNEAKTDPAIIQAAVSVSFLTPEKDDVSAVNSLFEWVRDAVRYVRDVNDVETLATPQITIQRMVGDCDDQSTLLAALCEAIGYPTRFVIAGYSDAHSFEHVYLQIWIRDHWVSADPTERAPLGWEPPGAMIVDYERV